MMIFFQKFQDFILEQPLNEMFSFFDMFQFLLCYIKTKNVVTKLKNQNGGLLCEK
jgi:hypothetical protein